MALIKCPECGEMISDKAVACIKCGYPIRELGVSNDNANGKEKDRPQAIETTDITESKRSDEEKSKAAESQKINKDRLLEYLRHAIRLEGNSLGEQNIIDDYICMSEKKKPQLLVEPPPAYPTLYQVPVLTTDEKAVMGFAIFMFAIAAFCLISFLVSLAGGPLYEDGSSKAGVWRIQIIAGIITLGIGIACTIAYRNKLKNISNVKERNSAMESDYRSKCLAREESNRRHAKEYNENLQAWKTSTGENRKYLHNKRNETLKVLDEYYKPNIIFPKYHTLPALTSIYEYISSGRCDDLTGPNGAYNLYEAELRQNTIIEKLNVIIDNLEQIRKNQYALYQELTRINDNTRKISNEMTAIRGYTQTLTSLTELNTYYNAITADNTAALTFLTILG